jgi:hypothetical protein
VYLVGGQNCGDWATKMIAGVGVKTTFFEGLDISDYNVDVGPSLHLPSNESVTESVTEPYWQFKKGWGDFEEWLKFGGGYGYF